MNKVHSINREALRLLTTALLLFVVGVVANAYDFKENDILYNILSEDDMTCEVTCRYSNSSSNKDAYMGEVVIPETATYLGKTYSVVAIGQYAFYYCSGLTSVTIPNSVITIGGSAFYQCSGLTEITIPNSVITIGGSAFSRCSGLTSVTIGNSVTEIGNNAFRNCTGLTSITIPNSVISIGDYAFRDCTGLSSVTIGESVTYFSGFYGCTGLTEITIPNSVETIGGSAFAYCAGLTEVNIPNNVTTIGDYAFEDCTGLTGELTIPNSVTSIGYADFSGCSGLTEMTIGNSVTKISNFAFCCNSLSSMYSLNPEPPTLVGAQVFGVPSTCVLYVPLGATKAYSEASQWKDFFYIEEIDVSPVADILANGGAEAVGYYTLDGKQVPSLQRGINVIRYSDGTARKVLVK